MSLPREGLDCPGGGAGMSPFSPSRLLVSGTSMMVENSAVCPAPHPDTALTHSVAALVLLCYLQL